MDTLDALSKRYFAWRWSHPWLSMLAELPIGLLGVLLMWAFFGRTLALVWLGVVAVLELLSLPAKVARASR